MPEDEIWVKRRESWIPPVEGAAGRRGLAYISE